jgi:hypothetical protein
MASLAALVREGEAAEGRTSDNRTHVSFDFQEAFAKLFARFTLARPIGEVKEIAELLVHCVERCPRYLGVSLETLALEEDKARSRTAF